MSPGRLGSQIWAINRLFLEGNPVFRPSLKCRLMGGGKLQNEAVFAKGTGVRVQAASVFAKGACVRPTRRDGRASKIKLN